MSTSILTGYTGERHITPAMDAQVNKAIFGKSKCVLNVGNNLSASMPNTNTFEILDGVFSIQGRIGITTGETLTVDNCQSGYKRIDIVVARFTHNVNTLVDSMSIILIKGTEVASGNPTRPSCNTGQIDSGASVVDLLLYQLDLDGSDVSVTQKFNLFYGVDSQTYHVGDSMNLYYYGTAILGLSRTRLRFLVPLCKAVASNVNSFKVKSGSLRLYGATGTDGASLEWTFPTPADTSDPGVEITYAVIKDTGIYINMDITGAVVTAPSNNIVSVILDATLTFT